LMRRAGDTFGSSEFGGDSRESQRRSILDGKFPNGSLLW
jgi:hypothetical protein